MSRRPKPRTARSTAEKSAPAAAKPHLWPLVLSGVLFTLWLLFLAAMALAA